MLKSVWTHRLLVVFDALVLGIIFDRLTGYPGWGAAAALIAGAAGFVILWRPRLLERWLGFDSDTAAALRSVILALVFFIECAIAALLIRAVV